MDELFGEEDGDGAPLVPSQPRQQAVAGAATSAADRRKALAQLASKHRPAVSGDPCVLMVNPWVDRLRAVTSVNSLPNNKLIASSIAASFPLVCGELCGPFVQDVWQAINLLEVQVPHSSSTTAKCMPLLMHQE